MLGLGRALGETIALALTLGVDVHDLGRHPRATAATRSPRTSRNNFGEADDIGRGALIASGLVLFAITLVVNVAARAIIYRRREFRASAA